MIDWVTATLPFSSAHKFAGGFVRSIDADGVVQWQTEKRLPVVGSHDAHFHIVSKGEGYINISGNQKWFRRIRQWDRWKSALIDAIKSVYQGARDEKATQESFSRL